MEAYNIYMYAIEEYGPIIHEFDLYFNYCTTTGRSLPIGLIACLDILWVVQQKQPFILICNWQLFSSKIRLLPNWSINLFVLYSKFVSSLDDTMNGFFDVQNNVQQRPLWIYFTCHFLGQGIVHISVAKIEPCHWFNLVIGWLQCPFDTPYCALVIS